jgi:hypothetical protein
MTASPLATGPAGAGFEIDVGAIYLTDLLVGAPARGASSGATIRVGFQRRALGNPLDDISVESDSPNGPVHLALQLKRTFDFAPGNKEFGPVMEACWKTAREPTFESIASRFGVAISHFPAQVKAHYARVPSYARASSDAAEFFQRIALPRIASQPMREFVLRIQERLKAFAGSDATDEAVWGFFKRLVIVDYDVNQDASRDLAFALHALRQSVPGGDGTQAQALFDALRDIVRKVSETAGSLDAVGLRSELLNRSIALLPEASSRHDILRLSDHTNRVLRAIDTSIGRVHLDRSDVVADALDRVDAGCVLLLVGQPGVGKSAVLRSIAEARRADGPVVALSSVRLADVPGWDGLASTLSIESRLSTLVQALSGGARPCLCIDGVDFIEHPGSRAAVNDILDALDQLPRGSRGQRLWSVLMTAREDRLPLVYEWLSLHGETPQVLQVPELIKEDLVALAKLLPHLAWVLRSEEIGPVIRNPYFLSVLERARAQGLAPDSHSRITEADVLGIWWERIVGANGDRVRQDTLLRIGASALSARSGQLATQGIAPSILGALEGDAILQRDADSDTYRFRHDILEEWTMCRVLGQHEAGLVDFLRSLGEPYWATDALQLLAADRLEHDARGERWRALLTQLENAGNCPGSYVLAALTASLRSARSSECLPIIQTALLEGDGTRLIAFLRAMRTRYIVPNLMVEQFLSHEQPALGVNPEERQSLILELGWPLAPVWLPVLGWLSPMLPQLPVHVREEASRMMLVWQRTPLPGLPFRREIAEAALLWRSVLRPAGGGRVYVGRGSEQYFERLRDIVLMSADVIPEHIPQFLRDLRETEDRHHLATWLGGAAQQGLAQHTPTAYADFALDLLVPGWRTSGPGQEDSEPVPASQVHHDDSPDTVIPPYVPPTRNRHETEWERLEPAFNTAFLHPSHLRGPFLTILNSSEREGLRLVNTLVNHATSAYVHHQSIRWDDEHTPVLLRFGTHLREFAGDGQVYQWFRPMGAGPYPVTSALMALEVWMEGQLEGGREAEDLFRAVLGESNSIAVVAVCVAMALAYPHKCLQAAEPFVSSPMMFEYDLHRASLDERGTFRVSAMLTGRPDMWEEAEVARDQRPQRSQELRWLLPQMLFSDDSDLRSRVSASVCGFPDDLSPLTPEEKKDPKVVEQYRRHVEVYAAWGDPGNYRVVHTQSGDGIQFQMPAEIQERNAELARRNQERMRAVSLHTWASQALESGTAPARTSLGDAVALARELHKADDFTGPIPTEADWAESSRLEAIVEVAGAALLLDHSWVVREGLLDWCCDILLKAAQLPVFPGNRDTLAEREILEDAARGLMLLAQLGHATTATRLAAFRLLRHPEDNVAGAVLEGVRAVWDLEPAFTRNAVARELTLATLPRYVDDFDFRYPDQHTRAQAQLDSLLQATELRFERSVSEGRVPVRIGLDEAARSEPVPAILYPRRISNALACVPLDRIRDGSERGWFVSVASTALSWTLAQFQNQPVGQRRHHDRPSLGSWPADMAGWLALLAEVMPEDEFAVQFLEPVRQSWPGTASISAELLDAIIRRYFVKDEIPDAAAHAWRSVALWTLPEHALPPESRAWVNQDEQEALELVVHVRYGRAVLTEHWAKAPQFVDIYDRWVQRIGHTHWGFRALLRFLSAGGTWIEPSQVLGWLTTAVEHAVERDVLWREHGSGAATAETLSRLWGKHESAVRADAASVRRFVSLLDELVRAGVPLAAKLRSQV